MIKPGNILESICLLALTLAAIGLPVPSLAAEPLTACNQDIYEDVYLTGDLDCTGVNGIGVNLHRAVTLELRGYSIRNTQLDAVQCFGPCRIEGPGTIEDNAGSGVIGPRRMTISGVTIRNNGFGAVQGGRIEIIDSQIEGDTVGVYSTRSLLLRNTTVSGSGGSGVVVGGVPSGDGRCRGSLRLQNSTVTGNVLAPEPDQCSAPKGCGDLESCRRPALDETSSCGTSVKLDSSETWGACDLD